MSLLDFFEKNIATAKTEAEREKAIREGSLRALWQIAELLKTKEGLPLPINYKIITLPYAQGIIEIAFPCRYITYLGLFDVTTDFPADWDIAWSTDVQVSFSRDKNEWINVSRGSQLTLDNVHSRFYVKFGATSTSVVARFWISDSCQLNPNLIDYPFAYIAGSFRFKYPAAVDANRHLQVDVLSAPVINVAHGKTLLSAEIDHAALGDNSIISATAGQSIYIYAIAFNVAGTVNVELRDGTTPLSGQFTFQAREGMTLSVTPPAYLFKLTANTAFQINLSLAIAIDGFVSYWKE